MATFTLVRETTVPTTPERILPLIADLRAWREWSPWEDVDPELDRAYSGAEEGVGAEYHWKGNRKAGEGHMTVTGVDAGTPGSDDPRTVDIRIDFLKPFRSTNQVVFTLTPQDEGAATHVRWRMDGPRPLIMRLLSVLMNPEKLVGPDLEKGLRRLSERATAA